MSSVRIMRTTTSAFSIAKCGMAKNMTFALTTTKTKLTPAGKTA